MESIKTKVRYIIHTEVIDIQERFKARYVSGIGKDYQVEWDTLGFFIFLKGSYEVLHVGAEKPEIARGDKVKITIEKDDGTTEIPASSGEVSGDRDKV